MKGGSDGTSTTGGTYSTTLNPGTNEELTGSKLTTICNDAEGYSIYAIGYSGDSYTAPNNTKLLGTGTITGNNISTGTSGDNSYWAMKLSAVDGITPPSILNSFNNYHTIPETYTQIAKYTSNTASATSAGAAIQTNYKISVSSAQVAGTYTGKVKYTMVHPNDATAPTIANIQYMQEFAQLSNTDRNAVINSMTTNTQYQLTDSRDNKKYYVAKLEDGNVWMTQNLDHDIKTDGSVTYDSTTTDVTSTWTPSSATHATSDTSWTNSYTAPESYDPGDKCWSGTFAETTLANLSTCTQTNNHYHIGNYYNWSAAVANNDTSAYGSANMGKPNLPDTSICPAGWGLPRADTGEDTFYAFTNSRTVTALAAAPAYFVLSNGWDGSAISFGSLSLVNRYWSAVSFSDDMSYSGNIDYHRDPSMAGRGVGYVVRCMARPLTTSLTGAGGPTACFPAGSQVLMSTDGATKSIEDINVGDSVISYDMNADEYYTTEVVKKSVHSGENSSNKLADVTLDDGKVLTMTPNHPILTADGFKAIDDDRFPTLTQKDTVKTVNGLRTIKSIKIYDVEPTTTYNLDVKDYGEEDDDETYDNYIVDGVVVHNKVV